MAGIVLFFAQAINIHGYISMRGSLAVIISSFGYKNNAPSALPALVILGISNIFILYHFFFNKITKKLRNILIFNLQKNILFCKGKNNREQYNEKEL